MGVHVNAIVIVIGVLVAAALFTVTIAMPATVELFGSVLLARLIAAGLGGVAIAFAFRRRPDADRPIARESGASERRRADDAGPAAHDAQGEEAWVNNRSFILFVQELSAATTVERVRAAMGRHLSPLIGTRRLWVASHLKGQRQAIVTEPLGGAHREGLLQEDGEEWTTFLLRVEHEVVGVLGVESGGGLKPRIRRLVQLVAPMIAQALNTAQTIDALREASLVDLLTGAATRREGMTRLRAEVKRAQRTGHSMAVLMMDLDRFKSVNDRFGHAVGDAVLTAVGRTLQRTLRASDVRCRWGGEEFLVVLPDTDLKRAQVVAGGLLRNIAATTVPTPAGPMGSTTSIGLTIARPGETDVESIIKRADIGLYRAKERGRGCIQVILSERDDETGAVASPTPAYAPDDRGVPAPEASTRAAAGPAAPRADASPTLPFPERRSPGRGDRRRVPSPGRRHTDYSPDAAVGA